MKQKMYGFHSIMRKMKLPGDDVFGKYSYLKYSTIMLFGHGDDFYNSVNEVKINFSSNVWHGTNM